MVLALVMFLLLLVSTFINITNMFSPFTHSKARVSRSVGQVAGSNGSLCGPSV